ncbi:MAG TPA: EB domain-containing protein, partial [Polyangia bacterium]|nr:EB domain-containing protein [Polyangia bacterium]
CVKDGDCTPGQSCVASMCLPPGTTIVGGACATTYECAPNLYCNAGTCAQGGGLDVGAECTADAVCEAGLRCDLSGFFGACATAGDAGMGATCASSSDCVAGLYCGTTMTCQTLAQAFPPFAGVTCADDGAFRVYVEVPRPSTPPKDFFRLPFPNDVRVTDGALDMSDFPRPGPTPLGVDLVQLYVDAWTTDFDGFSSIGVTTFRFSADIDLSTATPDNVLLFDVTPGASGGEYARDWLFSSGRTKYSCRNRMTVRNTTDAPLLPKHTYAVILTTGIKSMAGETPVVDPDMTALLATTAPADATLMHAWTVYQPLRDWLAKPPAGEGITAPSVAAAAVFTVQDAPGHVQRLADAVAAQPAPVLKDVTLCAAGVKSPCDDGTPARACPATPDPAFDEIQGRFSVPIFQKGTEPYDTPAQGGGIVETAGVPQVQRTEDVCFDLTVPKGAMPAAGWPLMVYHHGTGGSFRSVITDGVSGKLAGLTPPSATFSFDAVEHGARAGGSTKSANDLVFNPLNPRAARDNFLQGASDVLQAFRVAGLALDAATSPTKMAIAFDATKVTFYGHSQGSTSGTMAVAFSDAAPLAVFSGAGAFLTHSLLDKTNPVDIGAGLTFLLGEPLDDTHPVLTIFQSFFDRSDPLNYDPLIVTRPPGKLASKHVYMSWGTGDTYTPPSTLNANAHALGVPPVGAAPLGFGTLPAAIARPVSLDLTGGDGAKRTAAMFPYTSMGYDGHFVASMSPAAIADWSAFVQSYLATGTPAVP